MSKQISCFRISLFLVALTCFVWMFSVNIYAEGEVHEEVHVGERKIIDFDKGEGGQQQGDSVGYYFNPGQENDYIIEIDGPCSDLGLRIDEESASFNDTAIFTIDQGNSSRYWIHAKSGKKYNLEFYIAGYEEIHNVPFIIKKSPINNIRSISYQPASPVTLIENIDVYQREVYSEDNGFDYYYAYKDNSVFQQGAILTINDENGSKQYTFNKDNNLFECNGEALITGYNLNIITSDDQTPDNKWGKGKHKIKVTYMGVSTDVEVEVVESPVASISLNTDSIEYLANTDGWWDEDDQVYYYQTPHSKLFVDGLKLTVRYKDGSEKEFVFSTDEDGTEGFRCGDELIGIYGEGYEGVNVDQQQSAENPWKVGGSYPITVSYLGAETTVQAIVVENKIRSIGFKPDSIKLKENVDGSKSIRWNEETGQEEEYFEYDYMKNVFSNGSVLRVTDAQGTKEYTYNASKKAFECDGEKSISKNAISLYYLDNDDQEGKPWKVGETHHMTLTYAGKETTLTYIIMEKNTADQDAADQAQTLMSTLTDESSSDAVAAAREAYEKLTNNQKALVSDKAKANLETQEKRIADQKAASEKEVAQTVPVRAMRVTGLSHKIAAGKKVKLAINVLPENASNKAVKWSSSNTKVATVNGAGVVVMKKKTGGKTVVITATAVDGSGVKAAFKIRSMKGVVKKIAIKGKKKVKAGKALKLKAKVIATKGANKKVLWISSNTNWAKVNASGKVVTTKAGKGKKVKITAMATDGSGKKKTVSIKIK